MECIFTQEEFYWLDDILPGTKVGRIRRVSFSRNVNGRKSSTISNNENKQVRQSIS